LAYGEKCNAFFILAGSLADPEVFICNEYILIDTDFFVGRADAQWRLFCTFVIKVIQVRQSRYDSGPDFYSCLMPE
jgi:hypothetical protein